MNYDELFLRFRIQFSHEIIIVGLYLPVTTQLNSELPRLFFLRLIFFFFNFGLATIIFL